MPTLLKQAVIIFCSPHRWRRVVLICWSVKCTPTSINTYRSSYNFIELQKTKQCQMIFEGTKNEKDSSTTECVWGDKVWADYSPWPRCWQSNVHFVSEESHLMLMFMLCFVCTAAISFVLESSAIPTFIHSQWQLFCINVKFNLHLKMRMHFQLHTHTTYF